MSTLITTLSDERLAKFEKSSSASTSNRSEALNCITSHRSFWRSLGRPQLGALWNQRSASNEVSWRRVVPSIVEKGAAPGYSLMQIHPCWTLTNAQAMQPWMFFSFLWVWRFGPAADEREGIALQSASGEMDRETFVSWLDDHVVATFQ